MQVPTHLYLVSDQPTPNLTPALDPATAPKEVVLLISPDRRRQATWLAGVLKPRGIRVVEWLIDDAWDLEHIQYEVLKLLEGRSAEVERKGIALNVTGGTKPMSLAAFDAFRAYDLPVFYLHPERDRLIWMHPSGQAPVELANRVRLDAFFQAHGAEIEGRENDAVPASLRDLTDWLVRDAYRVSGALGTINWLASKAEGSLLSPTLQREQMRDPDLLDLIDRFAENGLLSEQGGRLRFLDEETRFFVNGGWLEEHVYGLLRDLRRELSGIQDLARSVDIQRETERGDAVHNELDVACLAENRLYIIECKTRKWGAGQAFGPGANALYRLDTLADLLGGMQGRAMLISYLDLPDAVQRRAADLHVRVCDGPQLIQLRSHLKAWIG